MKKLFLLLLTFAFTGCSTLNDTINTLPGYEFEQFDYSRTGNITSTTLSASNAKIENNMLIVEKAHVTTAIRSLESTSVCKDSNDPQSYQVREA